MSPSALSKNRQVAMRRIAFVQSSWHSDIVNRGRDAFLAELKRQGVARSSVDLLDVPGAFELPLLAKKLAQSGHYSAVVACGFVVNGGIYRHEFVADAVVSGLMQVQLETGVPTFSVVLTPLQFHESDEHKKFFHDHFVVKGAEAARACLQTLAAHRQAGERMDSLTLGGSGSSKRQASRRAKV
jgi:6,7-dimethyl-8-ribityllumazine synthase